MKSEKTKSEGFSNFSALKVTKEYEEWIEGIELQNLLENANKKCADLELDIGKKNSVIELLEGENRMLKQGNEELEKSIRIVKVENDELMAANKVLECEKNKAEIWMAKFKELESEVMELKKRLSDCSSLEDALLISTPCELKLTVDDVSPAAAIDPFGISDGDEDLSSKRRKIGRGVAYVVSSESETDDDVPVDGLKRKNESENDDDIPIGRLKSKSESETDDDDDVPIGRLKSKSESETDDDDNVPIGRLKSKNQLASNTYSLLKKGSVNGSCIRNGHRKQWLRRVDGHEDKVESCENLAICENLNDTLVEDEMDLDGLSSEGESLDSFIVKSSGASGTDSGSNDNADSLSDSGESDNMGYDKVISSFRRERKDKSKWRDQADMLADFGKCTELCMKAVCAVYRKQTMDEKLCKESRHSNGRGFSKFHAFSGSTLAEFLTDGDPNGDVKKSVKELEEFDPEGVYQCKRFAKDYSKQLFKIYKNKEDPFFHP